MGRVRTALYTCDKITVVLGLHNNFIVHAIITINSITSHFVQNGHHLHEELVVLTRFISMLRLREMGGR